MARGHGWQAVADEVNVRGQALATVTNELHLAANRYQDAALLAYYLDEHPAVGGVVSLQSQYPDRRQFTSPGSA